MDTMLALGREYRARHIDAPLRKLLDIGGAVVIEGPRACGKTMTGLHHAGSYALLDDQVNRDLSQVSPQVLLEGDSPRLLDEWQLAPQLWNLVRRKVDVSPHPGRFILTGSAVPADDDTRHSGAGRFLRLRQRTMTWQEKGHSTGNVKLGDLLAGSPLRAAADTVDLHQVIAGILTPRLPGNDPAVPRAGAAAVGRLP
ncbi:MULTISPECIES: AAA family ATPase [unclassified Luteococcus]|uniref:AAA family ATPase n=1 Tax=unclassified Luteococcus TaxID=2639923 RepID=UPI00313D4126